VNRAVMACRFEVTMPRGQADAVTAGKRALDIAGRIEDELTVFRETIKV